MSIINDFVAYVKQTWENRPSTKSPVSAERLGYMEDGIKENSDAIEKVAAAVLSTIVNDPDKIASMAALYAVNQTVAANAVAITELNSKKVQTIDFNGNTNDAGTLLLNINDKIPIGIRSDANYTFSLYFSTTYGFGYSVKHPNGEVVKNTAINCRYWCIPIQ